MFGVTATRLPAGTLLDDYRRDPGTYTDCFTTTLPGRHALEEFVFAFYTTGLFRAERLVLRIIAGIVSRDADLESLLAAGGERFSAWRVEARTQTELLLCDVTGRTRSWFRVEPAHDGTTLCFGSAVLPAEQRRSAHRSTIGNYLGYRLVLPMHRAYSRLLLHAARQRLASIPAQPR